MDIDPRFAMADTYRALRGNDELTKQFTDEINNCDGADDALTICYAYQNMA